MLKIVKGGPFGPCENPVGCKIWRNLKWDFKKIPKKFKMRFLNSVTVPKNVKRASLGSFDIHCVAKFRNKWSGDPLVQSKRLQKSCIVPKTIQVKNTQGGILCFRCSGRRCFCFGRGSSVSRMKFKLIMLNKWTKKWTDRVELTEKTSHCKSRAFSSKTPTKNGEENEYNGMKAIQFKSCFIDFQLFGCFLAWETRSVTIPALNDSKYIGINVYVVMLVCLVSIGVTSVIDDADHSFILLSTLIIFATTITLCLVFVPKVTTLIQFVVFS